MKYDSFAWTDDELSDIQSITTEANKILQVKPSREEELHAKDIFVYLNKRIKPLLKEHHVPLTILGFNRAERFEFSIGYTDEATGLPCSLGTLIALKALYEEVFVTTCAADIVPFPSRTPGYGIQTAISIVFGNK